MQCKYAMQKYGGVKLHTSQPDSKFEPIDRLHSCDNLHRINMPAVAVYQIPS